MYVNELLTIPLQLNFEPILAYIKAALANLKILYFE
jgi:hypothetical protein